MIEKLFTNKLVCWNSAAPRGCSLDNATPSQAAYSTHGRYSATANRHGENTFLAYDTLGRAWRKFLNNGLYEEYTYDASNRLISVGVWNPTTGTNVRLETYTYNLANQMTSKTVGGVTTSYTYDLAGQLASESRPGYSCSYTYDANGNRLTKTLNGVTETYTYDDGDKMLTAGSKSYGYDAAGRTTSVTNGASVTTLSYDWESRLTSLSGATTASYAYNGLDTRVSKIEGGVTNTYVRDGVGVTAPVIRDTFASYTPGTSEKRGTTTTFLHSGLKNAEMQTDTAKAVSATKQYDAFGNLTSSTGTWQGAFGYAGGFGYQEDASGLKLLGHRYYDSSTGRFLTRDPAKDGRNWYVYCDGDPVQRVDPRGLNWFVDKWDLAKEKLIDWWENRGMGGIRPGLPSLDPRKNLVNEAKRAVSKLPDDMPGYGGAPHNQGTDPGMAPKIGGFFMLAAIQILADGVKTTHPAPPVPGPLPQDFGILPNPMLNGPDPDDHIRDDSPLKDPLLGGGLGHREFNHWLQEER